MDNIQSDAVVQALIEQWRVRAQVSKDADPQLVLSEAEAREACANDLEDALRVSPPSSPRHEQEGDQATRVDTNADALTLRAMANHVCPVCDYQGLIAPPPDGPVCPCCGTEFEVDDLYRSHAELRERWIDAGAHWFSSRVRPRDGWVQYRLQLLMEHARRHQATSPAPESQEQTSRLAHARTPEDR